MKPAFLPLFPAAVLLASCSGSVDRPTDEEVQKLDEAEAMLDRLDAEADGIGNGQEAP
ncbi:hypothetical protein [Sphingomicrobium lutaoense]|uniref:Uncharacterized protein n=1 Tax=Sphingomicrobium lutaoense TaxID=515949 RepID=A0A839Z3D1_9SPHN|nr:hypothetical protein [Sphingomicrobium lutaoense]MBB3764313.1 hypothetical protein [Sphingomicrobium lutaoense]